jgi:rhodanese-related sulfurtransferase
MKIYRVACKNDKELKEHINEALLEYMGKVDKGWNYVTPEELHGKEDKYFLLDIRDKDAYKEGHIKGTKNIFWKDILDKENLNKLPKDKIILLICYVGHTSSQMLMALSLLGYKVKSLKFGIGKSPVEGVPVAGWLDYGYEVEK